MTAREGIRLLTPPIVERVARRIRGARSSEWGYAGTSWPASGEMRGWNVDSVVRTQRSQWPDLKRVANGTGLLTEGGLSAHNTLLAWAYALGRASSGKQQLSFLDWGGGLGQYGLLARSLYPSIEIEYFCRDLPLMVEAGRALLPDATFFATDEEAFSRRYDLVLASSSLQYAPDWRATLALLARSTEGHLFVTRHPLVDKAPSFVVVQRPARHGYDTEYPGWVHNKLEFLTATHELGLTLIREFLIDERPVVPKAPEQPSYRGLLFERQS